jgi:hypothetical protein
MQAARMKCAGCNGGNHTAWSKDCPARKKELRRAAAAKQMLSRLFPVASATKFFTNPFKGQSTESVRQIGASQVESMRLSGDSQEMIEVLDAPKREEIKPNRTPKRLNQQNKDTKQFRRNKQQHSQF